ncbi:bifunctional diaminohydroxyphosphoribosylaminopyrimidine deaminase/5-amino-6-(5-phosphoribosylamino)uracil reductase RibD [Alteromonas sp. A079]|uniref:bifunctional diaminohydroxyphosphoribosylaminopyrimidine deaminase/5-amino-6-(5-phosphoribosylamino)uracil reductase RibD n=1 Tax=Alteromonas sp. A079 TaxID=3410268 RepID=UPI003BA20591
MAKAIQLAHKGRFTTSPNPRVGCIIVDADNHVVGQGFHKEAGTPHAEVHALRHAKHLAKGATAYVTLEPCSHFGKTPPCADALIDAKVSRVVVGMTDPNPQVSGRGIQKLRDAGIKVVSGVLAEQAAALNKGFIKRMVSGKPYVRVKLGISLDGKIALGNGKSQWITGPMARKDVQQYRAQSCAVLTGSGTVIADNPSLLVRANEAQFDEYPIDTLRQPARVIVDSQRQVGRHHHCFNDGFTTYVACSPDKLSETDTLDNTGDNLIIVEERGGHIDLSRLLEKLGEMQFNEIWVEAGPGLAGALLANAEVDELICYQAPKLLGDKGVSMVNLPTFTSLDETISLSLVENRQVGNDIKLIYKPLNG